MTQRVEEEAGKDAQSCQALYPPWNWDWTLEAPETPRNLLQLLLFFVILASDSKP